MFSNLVSVIQDMVKPYTAVESWGYDYFIAPAVLTMARSAATELVRGTDTSGHILDIGCGGGQLLAWLAEEYPDARLTGLDLSAEQVARAKKRTTAFGERVGIHEGSALALPFKTASFDAVISVASIKHWPDAMQGLRETLRVLRPGGVFYVAEVDRGCTFDDALRFVDQWRLPGPAKRIVFPLFRTFVAGQGIDLEDARQYLRALGLPEVGARRLPGMPGVLISGVKPKRKNKARSKR